MKTKEKREVERRFMETGQAEQYLDEGNAQAVLGSSIAESAELRRRTGLEAGRRGESGAEEAKAAGILRKNGYRILFPVGNGATSQVYCVKEEKTGKNYACKVSTRASLLWEESCFLERLKHPLFPSWHYFLEEEGMGLLLMEYVEGESLELVLKRRGRLGRRTAVRIAVEAASGLACLHEGDPAVCYRDLKPGNIMLRQDGSVRLVDLGAACVMEPEGVADGKWSERGTGQKTHFQAGTIGYASPEQWSGAGTADGRSDIYSLGILLREMLTGANAVVPSGKEETKIFCRETSGRRKRWRGLEWFIRSCTASRPEERFPSMREAARFLAPYQGGPGACLWRRELHCALCADSKKLVIYEKNVWRSAALCTKVR